MVGLVYSLFIRILYKDETRPKCTLYVLFLETEKADFRENDI